MLIFLKSPPKKKFKWEELHIIVRTSTQSNPWFEKVLFIEIEDKNTPTTFIVCDCTIEVGSWNLAVYNFFYNRLRNSSNLLWRKKSTDCIHPSCYNIREEEESLKIALLRASHTPQHMMHGIFLWSSFLEASHQDF